MWGNRERTLPVNLNPDNSLLITQKSLRTRKFLFKFTFESNKEGLHQWVDITEKIAKIKVVLRFNLHASPEANARGSCQTLNYIVANSVASISLRIETELKLFLNLISDLQQLFP